MPTYSLFGISNIIYYKRKYVHHSKNIREQGVGWILEEGTRDGGTDDKSGMSGMVRETS